MDGPADTPGGRKPSPVFAFGPGGTNEVSLGSTLIGGFGRSPVPFTANDVGELYEETRRWYSGQLVVL